MQDFAVVLKGKNLVPEDLWRVLDKDRKNKVPVEEFSQLLKSMRIITSDSNISRFFSLVDEDHSGYVT